MLEILSKLNPSIVYKLSLNWMKKETIDSRFHNNKLSESFLNNQLQGQNISSIHNTSHISKVHYKESEMLQSVSSEGSEKKQLHEMVRQILSDNDQVSHQSNTIIQSQNMSSSSIHSNSKMDDLKITEKLRKKFAIFFQMVDHQGFQLSIKSISYTHDLGKYKNNKKLRDILNNEDRQELKSIYSRNNIEQFLQMLSVHILGKKTNKVKKCDPNWKFDPIKKMPDFNKKITLFPMTIYNKKCKVEVTFSGKGVHYNSTATPNFSKNTEVAFTTTNGAEQRTSDMKKGKLDYTLKYCTIAVLIRMLSKVNFEDWYQRVLRRTKK